jgi:imidazoleglycerol-phosphate dehydratase
MRIGEISRKTKETDITVRLNLDGSGQTDICTGIGFLDHMLTALAVHAGFDLALKAHGDLHVDTHHTAEDAGIVLGQAFSAAISDKSGIKRFGSSFIPLDEALCFACVDICGRPFIAMNVPVREERIGDFETAALPEFMRAFAFNAGITLHLKKEYGDNGHHIIEALFKAMAHALGDAVAAGRAGVLSTKGTL